MAKLYRPIRRGVQMSEAIQDAYANAPSDVVILHTLEFLHPNFRNEFGKPDSARVVREADVEAVLKAKLEANAPMHAGEYVDFQPVIFDLSLPPEEDSGNTGELSLSVQNAASTLIPYLDQAQDSNEPIRIIYRPYVSTDLTEPDIKPPLSLYIRTVNVDLANVTATAGFGDLSNRRFPYLIYKATEHPGLTAR